MDNRVRVGLPGRGSRRRIESMSDLTLPMKSSFRFIATFAALGLFALLPSARAQLSLAGSSRGHFTYANSFFTLIDNGPVTSTLYTGIPLLFQPTTSITFTGDTFTSVGDGDSFDVGVVKIKNGVTLFNTAATFAELDLLLNLPTHGIANFKLTTLQFSIEHTPNFGAVPDVYYIGYSGPEVLKVADTLVTFDLAFTNPAFNTEPGQWIGEKKTGTVGLYATVDFTPVPEPSTYAALAAAGLLGVIAVRRRKTSASAA